MEWIIYKSNRHNPESEKDYKKLSKKNKDFLNKWLGEKSIYSKSKKRAGNRRRAIIKLLAFLKKDYNKINYDDYVKVASAISNCKAGVNQKNGDRFFIKRFLKDSYNDWRMKFKDLELLKSEVKSEKDKIKPKELLTELEIDKLIKASSDLKEKSLIAVLSSSGARTEEILKLRWNDVDFDSNSIYLYSSKTGKRRLVPINNAINHLERLKKETEPEENDLVFPSSRGGGIMTAAGLNFMLQKLGKKAGIDKRIWSYLFRHTRLSFLLTKLSPKVYEDVAGHSLSMGLKTYGHLSQDKIIKEMTERVFEVKELTEEQKNKYDKEIAKLKFTQRKMIEVMQALQARSKLRDEIQTRSK